MACKRLFVTLVLFTLAANAQKPARPQVNPDGSITFRIAAPGAAKVELGLDLSPKHTPMTKGEDGVWTVTTQPLAPEYYGYDIVVDGVTMLDPQNPDVRFNYLFLANQVLVPGHPAMPWELTATPHGRVDHHWFTTHVAKHMPEDQSAYVVYTPPGYDAKRKGGYPVLYLLHGFSDNETAWTSIGRADFIFDNMIASGRVVPMIVVMPLGYGDLDFVRNGHKAWDTPATVDANVNLFAQSLLTEVMPAVQHDYNVDMSRESRAIAGLSMGGLESLYTGLNHTDKFAYVAGMSAAVQDRAFDQHVPSLSAKKADLRLLWVAVGADEELLQPNRDFVAWARGKGLETTAVEIPGVHVWLTWRDNLVHLAPLLFRAKSN
jgi:enterochelin esterase-like enzyme